MMSRLLQKIMIVVCLMQAIPPSMLARHSTSVPTTSSAMPTTRSNRRKLWIRKIIPYVIEPNVFNRTLIEETILYLNTLSCVQWRRRGKSDEEKPFVVFKAALLCTSYVGQVMEDGQPIFIGRHCSTRPIILHEMMHVMGFHHEMRRFDRDEHVQIIWENIIPDFRKYFQKIPQEYTDFPEETYDITSIMHYSSYAYSMGKKLQTIRSYNNTDIPHIHGLNKRDIHKLNKLYDCRSNNEGWSTWSAFSLCDKKCRKERTRFCYNPHGTAPCASGSMNKDEILQNMNCSIEKCSRDGGWTSWSQWSYCDVFCGHGNKTRQRTCSDPKPFLNGKQCTGMTIETKACRMGACRKSRYDCEFDNDGLCRWELSGNWNIVRSVEQSVGPKVDVSFGTGNYILLKHIGRGRMVMNGIMENNNHRCMRFYYSLGHSKLQIIIELRNGQTMTYIVQGNINSSNNIGNVERNVTDNVGSYTGNVESSLMYASQNEVDSKWDVAKISLNSKTTHKVEFVGESQENNGFVSLDDVFFLRENCINKGVILVVENLGKRTTQTSIDSISQSKSTDKFKTTTAKTQATPLKTTTKEPLIQATMTTEEPSTQATITPRKSTLQKVITTKEPLIQATMTLEEASTQATITAKKSTLQKVITTKETVKMTTVTATVQSIMLTTTTDRIMPTSTSTPPTRTITNKITLNNSTKKDNNIINEAQREYHFSKSLRFGISFQLINFATFITVMVSLIILNL